MPQQFIQGQDLDCTVLLVACNLGQCYMASMRWNAVVAEDGNGDRAYV